MSKKSKRSKTSKISVMEQFIIDFAAELDLFDPGTEFPAWVFDYRDDQIRKLTPEVRKIATRLKELGLRFKMKWPIEIDGKWKYADFFFPRQRVVLMVANPMSLGCRPHWMLSDRAEFFKCRYRVIEVETLADLERKMELKLAKA